MPGSASLDGLSCASKSTQPFPNYCADGTGRDMYMTGTKAPFTGTKFSSHAPRRDGAPRCGRTDPMPRYPSSGNGRDSYMQCEKRVENVVFPRTGKTQFSEKPPVVSDPFVKSRTDTMPRYRNDGTGRDVYLNDGGGGSCKIPHTGKQYSSRPPKNASSPMHLRTEPLPNYTASGSGRDTFHRCLGSNSNKNYVVGQYNNSGKFSAQSSWDLRSYEPAEGVYFDSGRLAGRSLSPKRASTAPGPMGMTPKQKREAHQARMQQSALSRLSAPKVHMDPVEPRGLMGPGQHLRPKSPPRPGSPSNGAWRPTSPASPMSGGFGNPFMETGPRASTAGSPTRRRGNSGRGEPSPSPSAVSRSSRDKFAPTADLRLVRTL